MKKLKPVIILSSFFLNACSGTVPDLGVKKGKLVACPQTPNCVSSQAADKAHYIEPLSFTGTQKEAINRLLEILNAEPQAKIVKTKEDYIRAEFTSTFFRFVDDVEFFIAHQQTTSKRIHIRSASRIGHSDLGVNRKRIEKIRTKF